MPIGKQSYDVKFGMDDQGPAANAIVQRDKKGYDVDFGIGSDPASMAADIAKISYAESNKLAMMSNPAFGVDPAKRNDPWVAAFAFGSIDPILAQANKAEDQIGELERYRENIRQMREEIMSDVYVDPADTTDGFPGFVLRTRRVFNPYESQARQMAFESRKLNMVLNTYNAEIGLLGAMNTLKRDPAKGFVMDKIKEREEQQALADEVNVIVENLRDLGKSQAEIEKFLARRNVGQSLKKIGLTFNDMNMAVPDVKDPYEIAAERSRRLAAARKDIQDVEMPSDIAGAIKAHELDDPELFPDTDFVTNYLQNAYDEGAEARKIAEQRRNRMAAGGRSEKEIARPVVVRRMALARRRAEELTLPQYDYSMYPDRVGMAREGLIIQQEDAWGNSQSVWTEKAQEQGGVMGVASGAPKRVAGQIIGKKLEGYVDRDILNREIVRQYEALMASNQVAADLLLAEAGLSDESFDDIYSRAEELDNLRKVQAKLIEKATVAAQGK